MGPKTKGAGQMLDDEFDDEGETNALGVTPQRIGDLEEIDEDYDDGVIHIVGCMRDEDCDCADE